MDRADIGHDALETLRRRANRSCVASDEGGKRFRHVGNRTAKCICTIKPILQAHASGETLHFDVEVERCGPARPDAVGGLLKFLLYPLLVTLPLSGPPVVTEGAIRPRHRACEPQTPK